MKRALTLSKISVFAAAIALAPAAHAEGDKITGILEKVAASIQKLEASCNEDIKKYCTTVTPGEGRLLYCMQAHEDKISPKCSYELNEVVSDVQATSDNLKEAVNSCRGDIEKLCAGTEPGQGRIASCLAANRATLSQGCLTGIEKLQ